MSSNAVGVRRHRRDRTVALVRAGDLLAEPHHPVTSGRARV